MSKVTKYPGDPSSPHVITKVQSKFDGTGKIKDLNSITKDLNNISTLDGSKMKGKKSIYDNKSLNTSNFRDNSSGKRVGAAVFNTVDHGGRSNSM